MFNANKDKKGNFTLEWAVYLIQSALMEVSDKVVSEQDIKRTFVFAKAGIKDENRDMNKYSLLTYGEFLEFVCRVSICAWEVAHGPDSNTPIYMKVYELMKHLY